MLHWSRLLTFVTVVLVIVVTPGPNTLYIVARSLHGAELTLSSLRDKVVLLEFWDT